MKAAADRRRTIHLWASLSTDPSAARFADTQVDLCFRAPRVEAQLRPGSEPERVSGWKPRELGEENLVVKDAIVKLDAR
jgi:hypothetical protein